MSKSCSYERLMLTKKANPYLYWAIIGLVIFILQYIALIALGETKLLLERAMLCFGGLTIYPSLCIFMSHRFDKGLGGLASLVAVEKTQAELWLEDVHSKIFTHRSVHIWIVSFLIFLITLSSLRLSGLPYVTPVSNIVLLITLVPFAFFGAHGAYAVIAGVYYLRKFTYLYTIELPFYQTKNPRMLAASRYYYMAILVILFNFVYTNVLLWFSPYRASSLATFWAAILSPFPLAMFLSSVDVLHALMRKSKAEHLDLFAHHLQQGVHRLDQGADMDRIEQLKLLMEIQEKVQNSPEWPVDPESVLTLIATLVIPLAALVLGA